MDYEGRVSRLQSSLQTHGVDALLVTNLTNVRYLTGFSGTNGQVLVSDHGAVFMSDPRYAARAADIVQGAEVAIYDHRLTDLLRGRTEGIGRLGVEAASVTVAMLESLRARLDDVELVPVESAVEDLRRIKDRDEIALIEEAISIGDETFEWALDRIAVGVTERRLALDLEVHLRTSGAEAVAFEPIVASGALSAHIHHTPSERAFDKGDLVLLDFGCRRDGYCSDLTRTVVVGPPTDEQQELYGLVLRAQTAGIAAARGGAATADVDAAARRVIKAAGHGDDFAHPLGHGVGLDVHEAPRVGKAPEEELAAAELRPGDVVTIEPGVYVRERGGIRIEDCVVITDDGCDVIGHARKDSLVEV